MPAVALDQSLVPTLPVKLCRLYSVFVGLWTAGVVSASAQIFLRLDGATGSSTDTNHLGWMDIAAISGPSVVNTTGSGSGAVFQDFCLSRCVDSNSPTLLLNCAAGTVIPTGTIDFGLPSYSDARFFRINLTNIYVTSVSQVGDSSASPNESLCITAQNDSWSYAKLQTNNGVPLNYLSGYWNLVNKTGSFTTNSPVWMSAGIRSAGGIILQWVATAGRDYRIYAVPSLSKRFQLVTQLTAATTGATNYTYHPTAKAMFYVVEEVPPGY